MLRRPKIAKTNAENTMIGLVFDRRGRANKLYTRLFYVGTRQIIFGMCAEGRRQTRAVKSTHQLPSNGYEDLLYIIM